MIYVLDANAMIALLYDELGADVVEGILKQQGSTCYAHAINLCEVFYGVVRSNDMGKAQASLAGLKALGIQTRYDMDDSFWQDAGS